MSESTSNQTPNTARDPFQPPAGWAYRPLDSNAIPALVLSLLWVFGIGSLAAVLCGHAALKNIRYSKGWLRGEGIAITALVFGYAGLLPALLMLFALLAG